jgi:uncharacterized membrane protein
MPTTPALALTLAFWIHMLATVVWIGGLAALSILVLPAARQTLDSSAYAQFLGSLQRRLDPLGWLSLIFLVATGMFQMSANPNYAGFLAISNRWAVAILLKHLVFLGMVAVSAYLTWGLMPRLQRIALRRAHGQEVPESQVLQNQEIWLMRANLILGILVLALTALARAS